MVLEVIESGEDYVKTVAQSTCVVHAGTRLVGPVPTHRCRHVVLCRLLTKVQDDCLRQDKCSALKALIRWSDRRAMLLCPTGGEPMVRSPFDGYP